MTNMDIYFMGWWKFIVSILPIVPLIIGWAALIEKVESI